MWSDDDSTTCNDGTTAVYEHNNLHLKHRFALPAVCVQLPN